MQLFQTQISLRTYLYQTAIFHVNLVNLARYFSYETNTCYVAALDNKYRHSTQTIKGHNGEVVSVLGYERSGPGFDSRRS